LAHSKTAPFINAPLAQLCTATFRGLTVYPALPLARRA